MRGDRLIPIPPAAAGPAVHALRPPPPLFCCHVPIIAYMCHVPPQPGRVYSLAAESNHTRERWLTALEQASGGDALGDVTEGRGDGT